MKIIRRCKDEKELEVLLEDLRLQDKADYVIVVPYQGGYVTIVHDDPAEEENLEVA